MPKKKKTRSTLEVFERALLKALATAPEKHRKKAKTKRKR